MSLDKTFDPERLKLDIVSASLFIAYFESFKDYLIENPQTFFHNDFSDGKWTESESYKKYVRSLDKKHLDNASLKWFLSLNAISLNDYDLYQGLRKVRNNLGHELMKGLLEGLPNDLSTSFQKLIELRIKLEQWWILNFEIVIQEEFDGKNIEEKDIITPTQSINALLFTLLSENKEEANYFKKRYSAEMDVKTPKLNDLENEKRYFLKNQFWQMSISAAFSRNSIYESNINKKHVATDFEKAEFKFELFSFVESLLLKYSIGKNNETIHKKNIEAILTFSSKVFNDKLKNGSLDIGTSQKILNLYLKYLWCSRLIDFEPPHFPLDRMIQEGRTSKIVSWTKEIKSYETYFSTLNSLSDGSNSRAAWELLTYNQKLKNGKTK